MKLGAWGATDGRYSPLDQELSLLCAEPACIYPRLQLIWIFCLAPVMKLNKFRYKIAEVEVVNRSLEWRYSLVLSKTVVQNEKPGVKPMLNTELDDQSPQHPETAKKLALDILKNHFDEPGRAVDVTLKKLMDRYRITDNEDKNCVTVEIERHRAALGCVYIPGVPMSAYQTYWMQYSINVQTAEVHDLGEREGEITVNISDLVDSHLSFDYFGLSIEPEDDTPGIYRISELVMKETVLVSDCKEAESFVLSLCPRMVEYFKDCLGDYDIDLRTIERYVELYEIELRKQILQELDSLWLNK